MVHLEDLDVRIGTERGRELLGEGEQDIHTEAHVRGTNDRYLARDSIDARDDVVAQARGADDQSLPGFCRKVEVRTRRRGRGEIDEGVGCCEQRLSIVHNLEPEWLRACEHA